MDGNSEIFIFTVFTGIRTKIYGIIYVVQYKFKTYFKEVAQKITCNGNPIFDDTLK